MKPKKFNGFDIYVSDKPNKKYYAIVGNKKIYFGSAFHEHYYDKLGYYKHLNHNDEKRRENYYKRFGEDADIGTAKYFSHNILW